MTVSTYTGLQSRVLFHHSHMGHLAIGAATMDRDPCDKLGGCYDASMASGGWVTRFDKGAPPGAASSDLPCDLVAMYAEGLQHISGGDDDWDVAVMTQPSCYALVVFRWGAGKHCSDSSLDREASERYVYLRGQLSFSDRITNDGSFDLDEAHLIARMRNGIPYKVWYDRNFGSDPNTHPKSERAWHHVRKGEVPGHVRVFLHRATEKVRETVDGQFGQGPDFFKLPKRKVRKSRTP
jgi:hypothetical protein